MNTKDTKNSHKNPGFFVFVCLFVLIIMLQQFFLFLWRCNSYFIESVLSSSNLQSRRAKSHLFPLTRLCYGIFINYQVTEPLYIKLKKVLAFWTVNELFPTRKSLKFHYNQSEAFSCFVRNYILHFEITTLICHTQVTLTMTSKAFCRFLFP